MLFEIWKLSLDSHVLDCQQPGCPVLGLWGSQGSPQLRMRTKASGWQEPCFPVSIAISEEPALGTESSEIQFLGRKRLFLVQ